MSTTTPRLLALGGLALSLVAVTPLSGSSDEQKLRDSDHKKFGKAIAAYYDAKDRKKGIEDAFLKVSKSMDKAQKKLKKFPLLSAVADWEQAFWYAQQATYKGRPKGGRLTMGKLDYFGDQVPAAYHLPPKYNVRKGAPYALVLCVPGAGEKPDDHLDTHWNDVALRAGALLVAVDMPTDDSAWGTFSTDANSGVWAVMKTFAAAKSNFAVDMNRVFLAGTGKGFAAAAATAASFPQCFAGVIGKGEIPDMPAVNFRNIPTLLVSPSEGAKKFEAAIEGMEYGNCTLNPEGGPADTKAFLEEHARVSYPLELTFSPFCNISTGTQWITVEGFQVEPGAAADERPVLNAKADRSANTVTIDAKKISKVTVYLNDSLVDMERPVKFLVNGTELEQSLSRNKRMMLDQAFNSGDWGRVFTAKLDLPVE